MLFRKSPQKLWLAVFWGTISAIVVPLFFYQISVDPFGVWNTKIEKGFNNYKPGQNSNARLFKPYQYADLKPKVVFFGDSRVSFGFPSEWTGVPKNKVYNFGLNGIHIPEIRAFVKFAVDAHRPEHIVIGLSLTSFNARANQKKKNFSKKRNERIVAGKLFSLLGKLSETVLSFDAIDESRKTVKASKKKPQPFGMFENGWYRKKGAVTKMKPRGLRKYSWRYLDGVYRNFTYNPGNTKKLKDTVRYLEKKGIKTTVFFLPYYPSFLAAMLANDKYKELEQIKREITQFTDLWDFANVNPTGSLLDNYIDGSHCNSNFGRKIIQRMSDKNADSSFGMLLTKENVDNNLVLMKNDLENWTQVNQTLYDHMTQALEHKDKNKFHEDAWKYLLASGKNANE